MLMSAEIPAFFVICMGVAWAAHGKYTWGDALTDPTAKGPDGRHYPMGLINHLLREGEFERLGSKRRGRTLQQGPDPNAIKQKLLSAVQEANSGTSHQAREGRSMTPTSTQENLVPVDANIKMAASSSSSSVTSSSSTSSMLSSCPQGPPARLCKTRYNTTAPMYGVSLTSGQPVTIVQKFPDLLQQVIFEVCESDTCDVVHGSCVQTYVPYLFLVIPLGPVTLTGQDYVLVESGCVCQPKYGLASTIKSPLDAITGLNP